MAKIVFFGASDFSVPILKALVDADYEIPLTVTSPDKKVGRKQLLTENAVARFARASGLAVLKPEKVRQAESDIRQAAPDLIVLAAYGKIIPSSILELPTYGPINIHPSLLPRHRGASPIQWAILEGDKTTGVTVMLMNAQMDEGPIIAQTEVTIERGEDYPHLFARLAVISAEFLVEILPRYLAGTVKPHEQEHAQATYTKVLNRADGKIDFEKSAETTERQIRAFRPWPGTFANFEGKNIKILEARLADVTTAGKTPGTMYVQDEKLFIVCGGDQALEIIKLQLEGKNPVNASEFIRSMPADKLYQLS